MNHTPSMWVQRSEKAIEIQQAYVENKLWLVMTTALTGFVCSLPCIKTHAAFNEVAIQMH